MVVTMFLQLSKQQMELAVPVAELMVFLVEHQLLELQTPEVAAVVEEETEVVEDLQVLEMVVQE